MDRGRADRRLVSWASHEGWWLWCASRHHPWDTWWVCRRLAIRCPRNLARRWDDWVNHRCFRGCRDFGLDYAVDKEGVVQCSALLSIVVLAWTCASSNWRGWVLLKVWPDIRPWQNHSQAPLGSIWDQLS